MENPILTKEFLDKYKNKPIAWGYNGLGAIVYKRTYSRQKDDGSYEEWPDTILRCISGAQSMGADYTKEEAERLFNYMFNLKCSFAGRMLWQLGTKGIIRYYGNSLLNCFFKAITKPEDFCFIFENLMLGGGVGYSVKREDIHELPKVKEGVIITHQNTKDADFIVPDSREGWVNLLRKVLKSYFTTGKTFTYSTMLVRGYGEPIKGFGGTASGPGILVEGITNICTIFKSREGKKLRSIDVLDICLGEGTKILTNRGYINIEKITNEKVLVPFESDENIVHNYRFLSTKLIKKGVQKTLKINTLSGSSIIVTPNHKFLVKKSHYWIRNKLYQKFLWKRADELKTNDFIVSPNNNSITKSIQIKNEFLTLGWITGDGYFTDTNGKLTLGANFAPNEEKAKTVVSNQFKEWYKATPANFNNQHRNTFPKISYADNGVGTLPINRQDILKNLIRNYQLKPGIAVVKEIPISILESFNFSHKASFLSGLFSADGCIQKVKIKNNTWSISLSSNSEKLIKQSYLMLKEFGIHGRITKFIPEDKNTQYQIVFQNKDSLINFATYIGFELSELKDEKLSKMLTEINNKKNRCVEMQKVVNIIDNGLLEVYDISLDEGHHFIAEGLVVHNCNIIGGIVVSGNVRRTAQIALGDPDDYLYIRAKRWDLGDIPNYRSLSNNTIYADDYSHIQNDIWEGYKGNGEPYGFINIKLAQKVGRLGDIKKDNCVGINPCLSGDTIIATADDRKGVEIAELAEESLGKRFFPVYCYNINSKKVEIKNAVAFKTGRKRIIKIVLYNGSSLKCTPEHNLYLKDGTFKKAIDCIGLELNKFNNEQLENSKVKEIIFTNEIVDVYDLKVEENHNFYILTRINLDDYLKSFGVLVHNCGELLLEDGEVCCLSDIFLNNIVSKEELIDCAKLLYKTQKAITGLNFLHEETSKVVHKNRRIGVGITGICQSLNKLEWLDECYKELVRFDKEWSKKKELPESIRLTTIKPSGSVALLSGATPGIHPAYAKYYIRRIRMASDDKLISYCKEIGYNIRPVLNFDGSIDYKTSIVEFPCFSGENTILAKDMTAIKQLELVKKLQTIWSDNSISVTVYYKKEELEDIKKWLKDNYKNSIKSVSFLLHKDHGFEQAPYEEITKEQYEELMSKVKPIINLTVDNNKAIDIIDECSKGSCPIK